jgi:hypothetical protein
MTPEQWGLVFWFTCVIVIIIPALTLAIVFHQSDKEETKKTIKKSGNRKDGKDD